MKNRIRENRPKQAEPAPAVTAKAAPTPAAPPTGGRVSDSILRRVYWVLGFFVVAAVAVVAQVLRIQYGESEHWQSEQAGQTVYARNVLADRGAILADDHSMLAVTLPFYRFAMDATVLRDENFEVLEDSIYALARHLSVHFGEGVASTEHFVNLISKARAENDRHVYLFPPSRRFNLQDLKLIETFPILNRGRFKGGFIVEKVNNKRFYPLGDLAKITLGRLQDDTTGTRGIEYSFNQLLRGNDGRQVVQRVAGGLEVPVDYFSEQEAQDGNDIVTTLNVNLQDVAHNALRDAVQQHNARRGVVIIMETHTGHIKALANYPEDYNMAVADHFEPGSTFKIASVMAALEDGMVNRETLIQTGDRGEWRLFEDNVMRDDRSHGEMTLQEAIEQSSNIAVAKVIYERYRSNPQRFLDRLTQIGALSNSEFQLRGEPNPYVIRPGTPHWSGITLPWLSTGYNVKLTPLQILTFYNAIANNGRMVAPLLVQEVRNGNEVVRQYETRVLRDRICSDNTLRQVRMMLEGVVRNGTARHIFSEDLALAGKSGTAKILVNGRYENRYRASFVGYFPANNPRYSCIVVIDEPTGGEYYGGKVAAPVFRRVAEYIYSTRSQDGQLRALPTIANARQSLPTARTTHQGDAIAFYNQYNVPAPARAATEYARPTVRGSTVEMRPATVPRGAMPDVTGMSARNALALLENMGMTVQLNGHGKVVRQSIPPNRRIQRGQEITLTLGS